MKKQSAVSNQQSVPAPRAVTHSCGEPAVEVSYLSPSADAILQVVICSKCDLTFYPKASRELRAASVEAA